MNPTHADSTPDLPTTEQVLDELVTFLISARKQKIWQLPTKGPARSISLETQQIIGDVLRAFASGRSLFIDHGLRLEQAPTAACWYDYLIRSQCKRFWLPINLKVSTCKNRDDMNSMLGLIHALTGGNPETLEATDWDSYLKQLATRIAWTNCSADYYLLVVEKFPRDVTQSVFWTSLLQLNLVHANGSNLPFQARLNENRTRSGRPRHEAILYLLAVLRESLRLRAMAFESYQRHIPPMIEDFLAHSEIPPG